MSSKKLQMSKFIIILGFLLTVPVPLDSHGVNGWRPLIPHSRRQYERPAEIMADVINNLGVRMLECYIEHPGNIAFSPTGLTFVLAALYEGSAGRGNRQIAHCLGFPRDRRVIRIGLRDIHRRLRTYLNADAFLGGLTLNRDDIVLRPEYEDILRFYGFNIGDFNGANGTMMNSMNSTQDSTAMNMTMDGNDTMTTVTTTDSTVATTVASTTLAGDANVASASLQATTDTTTSMNATTSNPTVEMLPTTMMADSASISSNLVDSTSTSTNSLTSNPSMSTDTTTVFPLIEITTISTANTTVMNNSSDDNQPRLIASDNGDSIDDEAKTQVPTMATVTEEINTTDSTMNDDNNNVRKKRSIRRMRSFPIYADEPSVWIDDTNDWQDYVLPAEDDLFGATDQIMTQLNFLVHGCDVSTISTATYTAILPFAYFPSLHALGLEFPLDDPRYNVIIFVPTEGTDTRTLTHALASKTLRHLRNSLKPTWVQATIPSFMLRGFITLTPYLQKLGINDAFEPRNADLSPMSPDLGIYARDIQQSIGVNIRNYMKGSNDSQPSVTTARNVNNYPGDFLHTNGAPIPFTADRPFLFFIVDVVTSASLIAGRIDDPLNSRIN